jgi:protein-serine/threonine kinase
MALLDAPDDTQASSEGDGQDSSEPPSSDRKISHQQDSQPPPLTNGHADSTQRRPSISHSSPDHNAHFQEPRYSHRNLEPLRVPYSCTQMQGSHSTATSTSPSPTSSSSPSESNPWSAPPTLPPSRPPSQAPSRAPSMSGAKPDLSSLSPSPTPVPGKGLKKDRHDPVTPVEPTLAPRNKGPPSVHSTDGGSKFNLRDLLGSAPKLSRKSSARSSASSRKSDSEGGPKSTAGESTSLLKKYGTCERVAIGKGATSVVRLAHKWDRTEEKLYAVKVILLLGLLWFVNLIKSCRSLESDARTSQRRSM